MEICTRVDIPATPIYALKDLPEHPQLKATRLLQSSQHPTEGTIRYTRPTTKFAETPSRVWRPAPLLGENSSEVLSEAGFSQTEIDALVAGAIVKQNDKEKQTAKT